MCRKSVDRADPPKDSWRETDRIVMKMKVRDYRHRYRNYGVVATPVAAQTSKRACKACRPCFDGKSDCLSTHGLFGWTDPEGMTWAVRHNTKPEQLRFEPVAEHASYPRILPCSSLFEPTNIADVKSACQLGIWMRQCTRV